MSANERNHSLSLPEFEARLWDELAELHAAQQSDGPQARSRSRVRYLAAAAVVLVVAAAGAVAAWRLTMPEGSEGSADVATEGSPDGPPVPGADDPATPEDGAGATDDPEAPEDPRSGPRPPDAVMFVEQVNADGSVDLRWKDEATGSNRDVQLDAAGDMVYEGGWYDVVVDEDGFSTQDWWIDHRNRTYLDRLWTMPVQPDGGDTWREDDLQASRVMTGGSVQDGLEVVDGRELLRLVDSMGATACATNAGEVEVCVEGEAVRLRDDELVCEGDIVVQGWAEDDPAIARGPGQVDESDCVLAGDLELRPAVGDTDLGVTWVDPVTYRPVKRLGYPGSDAEYTMTYQFLERTPENLALLEMQVPEGYVEDASDVVAPG